MSQSLNYDRVAREYHKRYESSPLTGAARALQNLARARHTRRILDVGCGTGRWLEILARPDRLAIGLDPSRGMLAQARARLPHIPLIQAQGEALPVADASFDLVTLVHVLHHLTDPTRFMAEAARCLMPGGTLALIGSDPTAPGNAWYIYDYFPGVKELDEARFPAWEQVRAWMTAAGFGQMEARAVEIVDVVWTGDQVFEDAFLAKNATSQLAMLSDEAYQAGIDRIRAAIAADPDITFHTHIEMIMMIGKSKNKNH
jgi:SAM-dependent methyltransferase